MRTIRIHKDQFMPETYAELLFSTEILDEKFEFFTSPSGGYYVAMTTFQCSVKTKLIEDEES